MEREGGRQVVEWENKYTMKISCFKREKMSNERVKRRGCELRTTYEPESGVRLNERRLKDLGCVLIA